MKVASNSRKSRSSSSTRRHSSRPRRQAGGSNFSGIHQRRDKRFSSAKSLLSEQDLLEQKVHCEENMPAAEKSNSNSDWSQAIMLWLSWNSTYEKAAAKMCKSGNKKKLEAMFNEMECLRRQAIELSQGLLHC